MSRQVTFISRNNGLPTILTPTVSLTQILDQKTNFVSSHTRTQKNLARPIPFFLLENGSELTPCQQIGVCLVKSQVKSESSFLTSAFIENKMTCLHAHHLKKVFEFNFDSEIDYHPGLKRSRTLFNRNLTQLRTHMWCLSLSVSPQCSQPVSNKQVYNFGVVLDSRNKKILKRFNTCKKKYYEFHTVG